MRIHAGLPGMNLQSRKNNPPNPDTFFQRISLTYFRFKDPHLPECLPIFNSYPVTLSNC